MRNSRTLARRCVLSATSVFSRPEMLVMWSQKAYCSSKKALADGGKVATMRAVSAVDRAGSGSTPLRWRWKPCDVDALAEHLRHGVDVHRAIVVGRGNPLTVHQNLGVAATQATHANGTTTAWGALNGDTR